VARPANGRNRVQTLFVVAFVGVVSIVVGHSFLVGFKVDGKQKGEPRWAAPLGHFDCEKVRPLDRGDRTCGYRAGISSSRSSAATM
jgi:hypothetical protein